MLWLFNISLFQLNLVTNCSMDWTMKDSIESLMSVCSFPFNLVLNLFSAFYMYSNLFTKLKLGVGIIYSIICLAIILTTLLSYFFRLLFFMVIGLFLNGKPKDKVAPATQ